MKKSILLVLSVLFCSLSSPIFSSANIQNQIETLAQEIGNGSLKKGSKHRILILAHVKLLEESILKKIQRAEKSLVKIHDEINEHSNDSSNDDDSYGEWYREHLKNRIGSAEKKIEKLKDHLTIVQILVKQLEIKN